MNGTDVCRKIERKTAAYCFKGYYWRYTHNLPNGIREARDRNDRGSSPGNLLIRTLASLVTVILSSEHKKTMTATRARRRLGIMTEMGSQMEEVVLVQMILNSMVKQCAEKAQMSLQTETFRNDDIMATSIEPARQWQKLEEDWGLL